VFLLASLVYLPPANAAFLRLAGVRVPVAAKVALGVAIVWFTLGVSDLGDLID
jgi:hypothetical protein